MRELIKEKLDELGFQAVEFGLHSLQELDQFLILYPGAMPDKIFLKMDTGSPKMLKMGT